MSAQAVLAELKNQGISLVAKDGRLLSKPPIPEELLPAIRECRADLIELLESDDQIPVTEDDFMAFFQHAIHKISAYWNGQPMPQPSPDLAEKIAETEDQLNAASSNQLNKADFRNLVVQYVDLNTNTLAGEQA